MVCEFGFKKVPVEAAIFNFSLCVVGAKGFEPPTLSV